MLGCAVGTTIGWQASKIAKGTMLRMVAYIAGDFDQVEVTSTISNLPALVNRQLSFIFPTQPLQKIVCTTIVRHLSIVVFHPVDLGALHFLGSVPGTSDTYTGLTNYTPLVPGTPYARAKIYPQLEIHPR